MYFKEIDKKHVEAKLYGNIGTWYANGDAFTDMITQAEALKYEELTIRMHCYGGSVFEGTAMYNAMQRSKLKINIVIDGVAASMACFILPAIENVFIADNAFGMIHRPSCVSDGDADSHVQTAKLLKAMESNFVKQLTERTGMTAAEIKAKWFDGKDHWLTADEMVQYGIAKKTVPATAKNIQNLNKETLAGMNVESLYNRFAACLESPQTPEGGLNGADNQNNKQNQQKMKKELIEAFGLQGVTAESTDAEVLAAMKAKHNGLEARLQAVEAEATAKRDTAIKTMLDQAVADGKVKAETRPTYEAIGKTSGVDALATVLGGMQTQTPIAQMIVPDGKGGNGAGDEPKTFAELVAKGNEVLAKWRKEKPADYARLYKAEFGHEPKY